jgi:hypothetical protein
VDITLKFWMSGALLRAVCSVAAGMWGRISTSIDNLSMLADAESCPLPLLNLLAWQRGIDRLSGEDDELFRRRVKYAYQNALDAGSVSGFGRIWERLELGSVTQEERVDVTDWDVILVSLDDAKFSRYRGLFEQLVALYGRTCRRYVLVQSDDPGSLGIRPFEVCCITDNCVAVY